MRRKTDKLQYRIIYLLLGLSSALAILAAAVSYKAINALDVFVRSVELAFSPRDRTPKNGDF